ncbi:tetratricopeptide repeat protein [Segatella copri]|uniref:Tetratricopeptide repeat protein n=1 Tax=Segatella copri TaxID=165179 RepID=A0AA92UMD9_9BACT|nr:tetratricopeptide repeat protein [Segatella copri]
MRTSLIGRYTELLMLVEWLNTVKLPIFKYKTSNFVFYKMLEYRMKQLFLSILFIFVCNSTFAQVDWVHYADSLEQISLHHDLDYQAILNYMNKNASKRPTEDLERSSYLCLYGSSLYNLEKFKDAIPYLKEYIPLKQKLHQIDVDLMEAYSALGKCYLSLDSLDLAEKYCRQGVVYFDGLSDSIGIYDRYELYKNLTSIYVKKGDVDLVRDMHRETQKWWAAFCLDGHPDMKQKVENYNNILEEVQRQEFNEDTISVNYIAKLSALGLALSNLSVFDEAKYELDCAFYKANKYFNQQIPELKPAYEGLYQYYLFSQDYQGLIGFLPALANYFKGDDDNLKYQAPHVYMNLGTFFAQENNPQQAYTFYNLAYQYMEENDEQENMVEIEKSCLIRMAQATTAMQETSRTLEIVQVLEKILTPKDTLCNILCSYQKGLAYLALQQYDLAVDIFTNKKMSLIRSTFGVNHPFYLDYLNELGVAYLWAGKLNEAIAEFKEAISIADSTKQERDLYLYYHNLGRAIMLTNDKQNALKLLKISEKLQKEQFGNVMENTTNYINECMK